MKNEQKLSIAINELQTLLKCEHYTIDKSDVKTVELINVCIKDLDPYQMSLDLGSRKTNLDYVQKEIKWYESQSRSVYDIPQPIPKIWLQIANSKGEIHSNYGHLIFSEENFSQYDNIKAELIKNPGSRRAIMIYTRPSMWNDYDDDGMSDFVCTNYAQCFIRDNKLIYIIDQRSADLIFGFLSDFGWHCYVYNRLFVDLRESFPELEIGHIDYKINSLHVYERHFECLKNMKLN